MPHFLFRSLLGLAATTALAGSAAAQHSVHSFVSKDGLAVVAEEAPAYLPPWVLELGTFSKSFACLDFEQRDTTIVLRMQDLMISSPSDGRIRIEVGFSGEAQGELYADGIYACFSEVTCDDSLEVTEATAIFDYDIEVRNGKAALQPRSNDVQIDPEHATFNISQCGVTGDVLNSAVTYAEGYLLDYLRESLGEVADSTLGPWVEDMLTGFVVDGSIGIAGFSVGLSELDVELGGVSMRIATDIIDNFAPAACVREFDEGPPQDLPGPVPSLLGDEHLSMAVNMGLINKTLYTVWRRGLMCLTDQHIEALGAEVDLSMLGALLPGFPPGTELSLDILLTDYPRVRPQASEGTEMTLDIQGLMIDLHGDRPDGTRRTLHLQIDADATATMRIDPTSNAVVAGLKDAHINRMVIGDEKDALDAGFDVARIIQMVEGHILPKTLENVGSLPVTAPAFAFGGYATILRDLQTTEAFATASLDLFRVPEVDLKAPDTDIVNAPTKTVGAKDAVISFLGTDTEIPVELLQYQVTVDGEDLPLTFAREQRIGEIGKTSSYLVQVAAVDLSGNVDPTPDEVLLKVDGIVPHIGLTGARTRRAEDGPATLQWSMSDDVTDASQLALRAEIFELADHSDPLSARLIDTREIAAGSTHTIIDLDEGGGLYRVEIVATDEAGNESRSSMLLSIASAGGCSVGGKSGGSGVLALWGLALLSLRRRKRE